MTAPTFVAVTPAGTPPAAGTAWDVTTTPKGSGNFAVSVGDVVVACSAAENSTGTQRLASTGTGVTLADQENVAVSSNISELLIAAGIVAGAGNASVSFAEGGGTGFVFGGVVFQFSSSNGLGAAEQSSGGTGVAPTLGITTTQADSGIVVLIGDYNAVNGASRTWLSVNGTAPTAGNGFERVYYRNASFYGVYAAYYPNAGAIGAKTVGLSAPASGMIWTIAALEVKGTAGADEDAALSGSAITGGVGTTTPSGVGTVGGSALTPGLGTGAPGIAVPL